MPPTVTDCSFSTSKAMTARGTNEGFIVVVGLLLRRGFRNSSGVLVRFLSRLGHDGPRTSTRRLQNVVGRWLCICRCRSSHDDTHRPFSQEVADMNNNKTDEAAILSRGKGVFSKASYITVGTKEYRRPHIAHSLSHFSAFGRQST